MPGRDTSHAASPSPGDNRVLNREGSETSMDNSSYDIPEHNTTRLDPQRQEDDFSTTRNSLSAEPQSPSTHISLSDMSGNNTWHLPPSNWEDERSRRFWTRTSNSISEGPFVIYEDPPDREEPTIEPEEPDDGANNQEDEELFGDNGPDQENVNPATIEPDLNSVDTFELSPDAPIVEFDRHRDDYAGDGSWPTRNGRRVLWTLWTDPTQEGDSYDLTYDDRAMQTGQLRLGRRLESPYAHLPLSEPARRTGPRRTGPHRTGPHSTRARRLGVRRTLDFHRPVVRATTPEIEDEADDEASDDRNEETEDR
ncbi:uncharacterized protein N7515_009314 [Penicillium bovifimosum]|uniref:Uncharacterized protein n=1 Tax=Penicillium bovifimosum TaxID=126998 RepID=A0A9W9GJ18_9EURO|nr:uncharacterized protein N7515_009314 [Penicillium bovifimosum]KAJ5121353.1 hypothetical protein N7515_009314 [Penicillium bovifimosum]